MKKKIIDHAFSLSLVFFGLWLIISTVNLRGTIDDDATTYCLLVGLFISMAGLYFSPINDDENW